LSESLSRRELERSYTGTVCGFEDRLRRSGHCSSPQQASTADEFADQLERVIVRVLDEVAPTAQSSNEVAVEGSCGREASSSTSRAEVVRQQKAGERSCRLQTSLSTGEQTDQQLSPTILP